MRFLKLFYLRCFLIVSLSLACHEAPVFCAVPVDVLETEQEEDLEEARINFYYENVDEVIRRLTSLSALYLEGEEKALAEALVLTTQVLNNLYNEDEIKQEALARQAADALVGAVDDLMEGERLTEAFYFSQYAYFIFQTVHSYEEALKYLSFSYEILAQALPEQEMIRVAKGDGESSIEKAKEWELATNHELATFHFLAGVDSFLIAKVVDMARKALEGAKRNAFSFADSKTDDIKAGEILLNIIRRAQRLEDDHSAKEIAAKSSSYFLRTAEGVKRDPFLYTELIFKAAEGHQLAGEHPKALALFKEAAFALAAYEESGVKRILRKIEEQAHTYSQFQEFLLTGLHYTTAAEIEETLQQPEKAHSYYLRAIVAYQTIGELERTEEIQQKLEKIRKSDT